jgi:glycerate 2-kinase
MLYKCMYKIPKHTNYINKNIFLITMSTNNTTTTTKRQQLSTTTTTTANNNNYNNNATTLAQSLFNNTVQAASPYTSVLRELKIQNQHDLWVGNNLVCNVSKFDQCLIVGAGKASVEMAAGVVDFLMTRNQIQFSQPLQGIIITKFHHGQSPTHRSLLAQHHIDIYEASHPTPCERGEQATRKILDLLKTHASEKTLVIWCASGGGSALTSLGINETISLSVMKQFTSSLLASGASIDHFNMLRKNLTAAQCGRSAAIAFPSFVLTLAISDVIGGNIETIAGGPTVQSTITLQQCRDCIGQLQKWNGLQIPSQIYSFFFHEQKNIVIPILDVNRVRGFVIGDIRLALQQALEHEKKNSSIHHGMILTTRMCGEAKEVGKFLTSIALDPPLSRPFIIAIGGETTVQLPSHVINNTDGKNHLGGRNQEMALAIGIELGSNANNNNTTILVAGTDGTDGPTDATGAFVTSEMFSTIEIQNIAKKFLEEHDSYHFFNQYFPRAHLKPGPTGTNVGDVVFIVGL